MKTRLTLAGLLLAILGSSAGAAVVTLKDGTTLRGDVAGQSDGLELVTPQGTIHVGLDRLSRVDYDEAAAPVPLPGTSPEWTPPAKRRQLISLGFGLIQPVSRVDFHSIGGGSADNGDFGAQIGAQYLYFLCPRLGLGLDVDYMARSGTVSTRLMPAALASVGGDTWLMLGILKYSLSDHGRVRPFLLAGAGGARNTTTVDARPSVWADTGTHETRRLVDDTAWTPAASVRAGADVNLSALEPGVLTFEAGWTGLAGARYVSTPRGQALGLGGVSGPLNVIAFTARYGWRF